MQTPSVRTAASHPASGYLLRELKKIIPQAEFLLTGSDQEKAFVQHVIDMTPGFRLQNVAGVRTLETLQQELATASFITGDLVRCTGRSNGHTCSSCLGPTQPAHFGWVTKTDGILCPKTDPSTMSYPSTFETHGGMRWKSRLHATYRYQSHDVCVPRCITSHI